MNLSEIIRLYRQENKISLDEFAKKCELSKGYISMLENGINPRSNKPIAPTLPTLSKIARGLSIDIDSLLKELSGDQLISLVPNEMDFMFKLSDNNYGVVENEIPKTYNIERLYKYFEKILQSPVTYKGKLVDDNFKNTILTSLKTGLEIAKQGKDGEF